MSMMSAQVSESGLTQGFEARVREVLFGLRAALSRLISSGGWDIKRASDLQRALGLRTTQAWKVYRYAMSEDPLAEVVNLPGNAAIESFLKAAAKHGGSPKLVGEAREATRQLDKLIETYAGTRTFFDAMIAGLRGSSDNLIDETCRRAAFRANSQIWGMRERARLISTIMSPSDQPGRVDIAELGGVVDLIRLRANSMPLRRRSYDVSPTGEPRPKREPIQATEHSLPGVHLLPAYCSQPLPELNIQKDRYGYPVTETVVEGIGNQSASTIVRGDIMRGVDIADRQGVARDIAASCMARPAGALVSDLFIHSSLTLAAEPSVKLYANVSYDLCDWQRDDAMRLPQRATVSQLGRGASAANSLEIPRYPEMFADVCSMLDWNPAEFDLYRCRITYPVLNSVTELCFEFDKLT